MKFVRFNDEVIFFDHDKIEIQDKLPHGIYQLKGNDEDNSSNSLKMLKESILEKISLIDNLNRSLEIKTGF